MQEEPQYTSKKKVQKFSNDVRSSQIFYNITDQSMNDFFISYIEQENENDEQQTQKQRQQKVNRLETENVQPNQIREQVDTQEVNIVNNQTSGKQQQQVASRLQIQIKKNGLNFIPVYGQIFIMLVNAQIKSDQKTENGKLLITNYRFAFFKGRNKKLDLPYGFIAECICNDKNGQILCRLKYDLCWKIQISQIKNYMHIKIFLQIYIKIQSIRSSFAFSYAHKFPQLSKIKHHQIINQFVRLGFAQNKDFHIIDNTSFGVCLTYPQLTYVPIKISEATIHKIKHFWNQNRFPVIVYAHITSPVLKNYGTIWRSSSIVCQRTDDLREVGKFFDNMKRNCEKLYVFDAGSRLFKRGLQEFEVNSQCQMKYLDLEPAQAIRQSYISMVGCFTNIKKSFIRDVLSSKWYSHVIQCLKGAEEIANRILNNENVLVKCSDGRQKSAILSALVQIIINPFYRTFQGFATLVEKQFIFYGYPFLDRLGLNNKKDQQSPTFILFLDCVSKLIYANEMCFQFNYKYLSKLSNLMYTTLFGTFVTNNRRQSIQNCIATQTVPIWGELTSELTSNAYFYQKSGILEVPHSFDEIRIWKQHFWYLTTAPKQSYKLHPLAEDNQDYVNLHCHKVMDQNKHLQSEISNQKKLIQSLKADLEQENQTHEEFK